MQPPGPLEDVPAGALTARQVAVELGITTDSLTRRVAAGRHQPDGRMRGRNWWWPETVASWGLTQPPADALTAAEVGVMLGLSISRVHALAKAGDLRAGGRHGGRGAVWWDRATVEDYPRRPPDVLWMGDVAARLGVSRETVRRLAGSSLPPDGEFRGRRYWLPDRFEPT